MKIIKEFKEFAIKGNLVDMAVGVIIGVAFGKIVTSLVNDIILPPIGLLAGGVNFSELSFVLKTATIDNPQITLNYGNFLQVLFDFLIIAIVVFMLIKAINVAKKRLEKSEENTNNSVIVKSEETLLAEIRDILKEINTKK